MSSESKVMTRGFNQRIVTKAILSQHTPYLRAVEDGADFKWLVNLSHCFQVYWNSPLFKNNFLVAHGVKKSNSTALCRHTIKPAA